MCFKMAAYITFSDFDSDDDNVVVIIAAVSMILENQNKVLLGKKMN